MRDMLSIKTQGLLDIFLLTKDGERQPLTTTHNDFQKTGCGVIASCLYGSGVYINRMYMLFYNSGTAPTITGLSTGETALADLQYADADRNYCSVPVIQSGITATSGLGNNIVTFTGITDGMVGGTGANFTAGSIIYAAALVCATDSTPANDLVFSVASLTTPVTAVANAQLGVSWKVTILFPAVG